MAVCTAGCAILGPKADERPLDGMTVEEKIGQLLYIGLAEQDVAGNQRWISRLQPGGIILFARNFSSLEQTIAELNAYRQNADLSIPLFVGTDQEGGMVSRLPSWATQFPAAASVGKHPTLAGDLAQAMGKELAALGINMNFAPVLDINSNPANPVIGERAFGDKPEVVATVGLEVADGLQAVGVVPVVKHFPGHGDTIADSHYQLPVINSDMAQLERRELKPFREAVSRGVPAIMLGHLLVPALDAEQPASLSASVITGLLREEWGYQGLLSPMICRWEPLPRIRILGRRLSKPS